MIDAQAPLQKAIDARVKSSSVMKALIGDPCRFFDKVPTNLGKVAVPFPYGAFGPMESHDASDTCHDGVEIFAQIDGWSRAVGLVEARTIGAALALLLDDELEIDGFAVIVHEVESLVSRTQLDGLTGKTELRLRYVLAPRA